MAAKKTTRQSDRIHQLKITLKGVKPPVWRRVEVPGEFTLYQLHAVIQRAMGWDGGHLHQFVIDGLEYGMPDDELGMDAENEVLFTLDHFHFGEKSKFNYQYDFGDDWVHEILVEKILLREPGKLYPVCVKGKRACPPEDVAEYGATPTSSTSRETRNTLNAGKCWSGQGKSLTPSISISMQ